MPECPNCKTPYNSEDRYCNQCGARLQGNQFLESGAVTRKALDVVDVYFNLGLVHYKKGEHRKALEVWEKALARDPGNELLQEHIDQVKEQLGEGN